MLQKIPRCNEQRHGDCWTYLYTKAQYQTTDHLSDRSASILHPARIPHHKRKLQCCQYQSRHQFLCRSWEEGHQDPNKRWLRVNEKLNLSLRVMFTRFYILLSKIVVVQRVLIGCEVLCIQLWKTAMSSWWDQRSSKRNMHYMLIPSWRHSGKFRGISEHFINESTRVNMHAFLHCISSTHRNSEETCYYYFFGWNLVFEMGDFACHSLANWNHLS